MMFDPCGTTITLVRFFIAFTPQVGKRALNDVDVITNRLRRDQSRKKGHDAYCLPVAGIQVVKEQKPLSESGYVAAT